ncbi:MAG: right-handed parallel beta-helix repeat-containing protein, partial [Planctomycetota bacterium]
YDGDTFFTTEGATTDGPAHAACQFDGQTYYDIWLDYTATHSGTVEVSTCNQADYDTDLVIYDGCDCPVEDARLLDCNDDTVGCDADTSVISASVIAGNCYKIRVGSFADFTVPGTGTLTISYGQYCGDGTCDPGENCDNCPGDCGCVMVCWDGSGDYLTIQEGINAAVNEEEVVVCNGTYTGSNNRNLDFGGKAITVRSRNGPDNCIINLQSAGRAFHFHSGETATSVVEGFTITSGAVDSGSPGNGFGGAILANASSPTIKNCIINNNDADYGGGISCVSGSNLTISDCRISNNTAAYDGGGMCCYSSSAAMADCTVTGNMAATYYSYGGGIYWEGGELSMANCTISDNRATFGGGLFYDGDANGSVTNCTIAGNTARDSGGGMVCRDNSHVTITNVRISENSALGYSGEYLGVGGGIACISSNPAITNSTIAGNTALFGGAIKCVSSSPTITNCILGSNAPDEIHIDSGTPVVTYSDVTGGWAGVGNIDEDPCFADHDGPDDDLDTWEDNDWSLGSASPCIDEGDNTVDMGAYEHIPDCNENGIPDPCDTDCTAFDGYCDVPGCGQSSDDDGSGVPDECEIIQPPGLPTDPTHQAHKNRYISINPQTNSTADTVLKVEVAEMRRCQNAPTRACMTDTDCDDVCDDVVGDPPYHTLKCPPTDCSTTVPPSVCIASGPCVDLAPSFIPPLVWVVRQPIQDPTGGCKRPECPPYPPGQDNCCEDDDWMAYLAPTVPDLTGGYTSWAEVWMDLPAGVLHITDCGIVPATTYAVYACVPDNLDECAAPLMVSTAKFPVNARPTSFPLYADVCGGTAGSPPKVLSPDGYVSVKDLLVENLTIINYGSNNLPQMHPTWADLHGPGTGIPPNYNLSVADLMAVYVFSLTDNKPYVNTQGGLDPQGCP